MLDILNTLKQENHVTAFYEYAVCYKGYVWQKGGKA